MSRRTMGLWCGVLGSACLMMPACGAETLDDGATDGDTTSAAASDADKESGTDLGSETDSNGAGGTSTGGGSGSGATDPGTDPGAEPSDPGGGDGIPPVDECNSTGDCQAVHGMAATDCVNSQSDQSWCACGDSPCVATEPGGTGGSPGAGTGGSPGSGTGGTASSDDLYEQIGSDPSWETVLDSGQLPSGENSTTGYTGSVIDVNNPLVELAPFGDRTIPTDIKIHTVGNSNIRRSDFGKWSRWYQEEGNTQIFRLFEGEHNVRNDRGNAARVEAFSGLSFSSGWHEWSGRYTIVKPGNGAAIFQSKGSIDHWSVMINMNSQGDITLNRRVGNDEVLAYDMVGKSFDLRVRDNGFNYEVYFDGELAGTGSFARSGNTSFRWGMYKGDNEVTSDIMIFVSGAHFE